MGRWLNLSFNRNRVGTIVVVCLISLVWLGCQSSRSDKCSFCANATDSSFIYSQAAYEHLVDSLMDSKFRESPDSILTRWSWNIIDGWFQRDEPGQFWSLCDSLFHISRVLYSCEVGAVDGPGYTCNALVCTDSGVLAIGTFGTYVGMDEIHVPISADANSKTEKWITTQLRLLSEVLSRPDTIPINPHTRGIAVERVEVDGKQVVALSNGPVNIFGSNTDSLYSYIFDLLNPVAEEASRHQFHGKIPSLPPVLLPIEKTRPTDERK